MEAATLSARHDLDTLGAPSPAPEDFHAWYFSRISAGAHEEREPATEEVEMRCRSANFTATNLLLSYLAMYQLWQKFTFWQTLAILASVLVSLEE